MSNAKTTATAIVLLVGAVLLGGATPSMAKQDKNITEDPDDGGGSGGGCTEDGCAGTRVFVFDGNTDVESTYNGCRTDSADCTENDDGDTCNANCSSEICFEQIDDAALYFTDFVRGDCSNEELADGEDIHLGYTIDPDKDVKCEGFLDCELDCNQDFSCGSGLATGLEPSEFVNTRILYEAGVAHVTLINNTLPARTLDVSDYRFRLVSDPLPLADLNETLDPTMTSITGADTLAFGQQVTLDITLPGFRHVIFGHRTTNAAATSSSETWTQFHNEPHVPAVSDRGLAALAIAMLLAAGLLIRWRLSGAR